jgi:predicted outer membrane repeat protein
VYDSSFSNGVAVSGGAINSVYRLLVTQCAFQNHTVTVGGAAIYTSAGGITRVQDSLFSTGLASSGAAIYSESTTSINNCKFNSNVAKTSGGVIYCDGCIITVSDSTFSDNRCTNGDGGALYIQGSAIIQDSTFTANDAVANGGAVVIDSNTTLQLSNARFQLNTAGRAGAALFNNGKYVDASITIDNMTVFTDNSATCCYAQGIGSLKSATTTNSSISTTSSTGSYTCQDLDSGGERGAECCVNGQYTDGQQCITCSDQF